MKQYYQLVREYGKYDLEYIVYEARKEENNDISIAAIPFTLVGNHPDEILDTLLKIKKDIKEHPAVDKAKCSIYNETLWVDDDDWAELEEDRIDLSSVYPDVNFNFHDRYYE